MPSWLVRSMGSEPQGPYSTEQIIAAVDAGDLGVEIEVTPQGSDNWLPIEMVPEFAELAFFDGETNVIASPWFQELARSAPSQPAPAPHDAHSRAPAVAPPPAPVGMPPRPAAPQHDLAPRPAMPVSDRDQDAIATKVVQSPLEFAARVSASAEPMLGSGPEPLSSPSFEPMADSRSQPGDLYDDFDETMTRVAVGKGANPLPPTAAFSRPGVLPTLSMDREALLGGGPPAGGAPGGPSYGAPSPAAAPPPHAHAAVDPLAPTAKPYGNDAIAPYVDAAPPYPNAMPYAEGQQFSGPPMPPQGFPPQAPAPTYGQPSYPQPQADGSETGIKVLIVLIVLLAMALTVVLVLLITQS
ncbi:MAG: DUF4339 domain-containing protein [Polyangiaceae bacterium]